MSTRVLEKESTCLYNILTSRGRAFGIRLFMSLLSKRSLPNQ